MSKELLFVYGTLLDEGTRETVIGRKVAGKTDELSGYREQAIEINHTSYPCAAASEGSTIQGVALELSSEELQKVDEYETGTYDRRQAELASGVTAWVYTLPVAASSNA